MSEWKGYRLGDLISFSSGGTPDKSNSSYWEGEIPWISAKSMNCEKISTSNLFISKEGLNKGSKTANKGTILLLTRGSGLFNNIPICWVENDVAYNQDIKCLDCISKETTNKYIYYWLYGNKKKLYEILETTGIGAGKFDTKLLQELVVPLPSLTSQNKVINLIEPIFNKIENNNKINAKLEEIAQNLFKEWFVDFGPFKNGKFVESELGLIPEGWRVGTLGEVCTKITDGSHFSPQNSDKDNIPMLSVKDMEEYGFNYKSCKHISKEDYLKLKDGDCVPLVDDILVAKDGSYLKEIFICDEFKKQAILSSIAIFRPKREIVFPDYLLGILKSPKVMKDVKENYVSGSAVPRIVLKDFKKLPILVPTYTVQSEFTDIYNSCRKQIYNNCKENQRLATLRDTLLPKLMSGEIEV